jgi:GxxExxY protein
MSNNIFPEESYAIMGVCFEVYKEMGPGFLEEVYHECLKIEFELRAIPFRSNLPISLSYKNRKLKTEYEPDFICCERIVLEIKAVGSLTDIFRAKGKHYLKATGLSLGILINFNHTPKLEYERIAL